MPTLEQKLRILGEAARYDASCATSGSNRGPTTGAIGSTQSLGICHSWSADGRCVSLLKVLLSNACSYDCAYCVNRRSADVPRATLTPAELAEVTIEFYRRNYIEGLFLSSAIIGDPTYTTEQMIKVLQLLRHVHRFNAYIHVKALPGVDPLLLHQLGLLADRLSVNIELPSEVSLKRLAPDKGKNSVFQPMAAINKFKQTNDVERMMYRNAPAFAPAGQSTQLIVGASPESDLQILKLSQQLYKRYRLKRVYYSAYIPVGDRSLIPIATPPPLLREHRLYQADWLVRIYGFDADELLDENMPHLLTALDPKAAWALRHREYFPLEVNTADKQELMRVPGLGQTSAQRIVAARKSKRLQPEDVAKMGMVMKRAQYFLTADGHYLGSIPLDSLDLERRLRDGVIEPQLSLFEDALPLFAADIPAFLSEPRAEQTNHALRGLS